MTTRINEQELLSIALRNLNRVHSFDPFASYPGVNSKADFIGLINNDPAFCHLGLGTDEYVMARIGGNLITSLHRKIGDMYENIFSYLLIKVFNIPEHDLHFSVNVRINDRFQERSTDGLIPKEKYKDNFPLDWRSFDGVGFELRSCYQIGDSKRIQADYDMALALKANNILPVMLIFCETSLRSPVTRLRNSWDLYEGADTFRLIHAITGFDLHDFMFRHRDHFSESINTALSIG
ncbi:hypothetical protein [Methylomagnum ishizawai]|uniref:hypothetical protein n=1 Tax=Methylomagnum ishizawai TaxID=1760988 RepID=UPI001C32047E|nr:hypothetical protein [Methylomagnum ishizawai]BBL73708.1 hypothetical protein MishRS11D_08060 [Methylomagnum ishizawai]